MIDNIEKAVELMEDMKLTLPIPVRPTPQVLQNLKSKSTQLPDEEEWQIESLFYTGDEGGIVCVICLPKDSTELLAVSLTHVRVDYGHTLSHRIREYQSRRVRRLSRQSTDDSTKQVKTKSKSISKEKKRKRRS